jgi:hypothetical protein
MNTTNTFSNRQMIKAGWHIFKSHWKFIWLAGLATAIIQIVLQLIQNSANSNVGKHLIFSLIVFIFVFVIGIIITLGWSKVLLALVRSTPATWNTFKTEPNVWLQYIKVMLWYIGYFIMYAIIAALPGIILLIIGQAASVQVLTLIGTICFAIAFTVTAIYFATKYQFARYVVLDHPELSSRNIFRKSGALTKGILWKLFGFSIVLGLVNLLGLICIVIGLAFTIPATKLAQVKVYEYLKEKHSAQ